ncbi:MAG: hypothetical protein D6768_20910 [Chloroflexi bacterium]|nr:MAG: hypothetical protein D6768_20910 [Chloroflexota bacterium]
MPSSELQEKLENLDQLISLHERRLQLLKEQQARQGYDTPAHVVIEIEDIEAALGELRAERQSLDEPATETGVQAGRVFITVDQDIRTTNIEPAIRAFAAVMGIAPSQVEVKSLKAHSVLFELLVPEDAIKNLLFRLDINSALLRVLKITNVVLEIRPQEFEEWENEDGKFYKVRASIHDIEPVTLIPVESDSPKKPGESGLDPVSPGAGKIESTGHKPPDSTEPSGCRFPLWEILLVILLFIACILLALLVSGVSLEALEPIFEQIGLTVGVVEPDTSSGLWVKSNPGMVLQIVPQSGEQTPVRYVLHQEQHVPLSHAGLSTVISSNPARQQAFIKDLYLEVNRPVQLNSTHLSPVFLESINISVNGQPVGEQAGSFPNRLLDVRVCRYRWQPVDETTNNLLCEANGQRALLSTSGENRANQKLTLIVTGRMPGVYQLTVTAKNRENNTSTLDYTIHVTEKPNERF